jgi:PAS domain S-box-containing protein
MPADLQPVPFAAALTASLTTLGNLIAEGILVYSLQGDAVLINAAGRAILGLSAESSPAECAAWFAQHLCDSAGTPLTGDDLPLARVARGETLHALEVRYRGPDGSERLLHLSGQYLQESPDHAQGILLVFRDISAEPVAHPAYTDLQDRFESLNLHLSRQAAQFRTVIASLPDGITIVDTAGNVLHMNEAGQRILGRTPAAHLTESVGRYDVRTLEDEPMSPADLPLARALRGEQVVGMEHLICGISGAATRINVSASPVHGQEDDIIGAVAVFRDVTRRRRQETERQQRLVELEGLREIAQATALARREAAIYEALVTHLARLLQTEVCVLLMRDDDSGNFTARSPAYGMTAEQVATLSLSQETLQQVEEQVGPGYPLVLDARNCPPGSATAQLRETFGAHNTILARLTVRERVIGLILAYNIVEGEDYFDERDIRLLQTVAPQAALAIENSRLYTHARQISAEARAQARHLTRVNDELDAFTYSVSHDLRAPLRAITGFTRLLERSLPELSDRTRHQLTRIQVNVDKMSNLIDALLAFSRAGRQTPDRDLVDTHAVVQEALKLYAQSLAACAAHVHVSPLPPIQGDSRLLEQVFVNLISNAIKYRRPDTPLQVQISGTQEEGMVTLIVRDNGMGFDMRYHDKIFQVFQRLHTDETSEGTGIGLALVRKIIERHDGRIWAEGTPGVGSVFFIELPAFDGEKEHQRGG